MPCPSWCETEHRDSDHPEDRVHAGLFASVDLSMQPLVEYPSSQYRPAQLDVYLERGESQAASVVRLLADDVEPRVDITLTLAEAEQVFLNLAGVTAGMLR